MAKSKKSSGRRPTPKGSPYPAPALPAQFLEKAAQGWLQSSGPQVPATPPTRRPAEDRLTQAWGEVLLEYRREIAEIRSRLERLENRGA